MGPVVVTGATGGVGSMAVHLLARAGYEVIASTGKRDSYEYLTQLGASAIMSREDASDESGKPLTRSRWAGAIDTVGGNTLATLIKACKSNGSIAACGLVGSPRLQTTVYPFIINGVNLLGIDSATCPMPLRLKVWNQLAEEWDDSRRDAIAVFCPLEKVDHYIDLILAGKNKGRVVVEHQH